MDQKNSDLTSKLEATRRMVTLLMHHDKMGSAVQNRSGRSRGQRKPSQQDVPSSDTDDDFDIDANVGERPAATEGRRGGLGVGDDNMPSRRKLARRKTTQQGPAPPI